MIEKPTGGPAFPGKQADSNGMSLRDYFAGLAMQGELSSMNAVNEDYYGLSLDITDEALDRICKHWYRIANAMIKAREA